MTVQHYAEAVTDVPSFGAHSKLQERFAAGAHSKAAAHVMPAQARVAALAGAFVLLLAALYLGINGAVARGAARAPQNASGNQGAASALGSQGATSAQTDSNSDASEASCPPLYGTAPVERVTSEMAARAEALAAAEAQRAAADASKWRAVDHIEEILQYPDYPSGCEPVSLVILLRSFGFDTSPQEIIDGYLITDSENYEEDYMGDVYSSGGAFPVAMAATANAYLKAHGSTMVANDLTGAPFSSLIQVVQAGNPVMVWTTMYMQDPYNLGYYDEDGYYYYGGGGDDSWYDNEHCVVLYGVDGDDVLVSDPLEGLVRRNAADFQRIYEECGSMAMDVA